MSDTLPSYIIQEDNFIFYVQLAQVRGKLEFTRVKLSDTASCGIRSSSRDLFQHNLQISELSHELVQELLEPSGQSQEWKLLVHIFSDPATPQSKFWKRGHESDWRFKGQVEVNWRSAVLMTCVRFSPHFSPLIIKIYFVLGHRIAYIKQSYSIPPIWCLI